VNGLTHLPLPPFRSFKELIADVVTGTHAVLEFLGVGPVSRAIAAGTRRQADEMNDEWARRYRSSDLGG
jgi:LPS sulfotransferase NodH